MTYMCPVCGYKELKEPPADYEICPSCGTEFGYNDAAPTFELKQKRYEVLRDRWLMAGAPWFDYTTPPPPNWNPYKQLFEAHLGYSIGVYEDGSSSKYIDASIETGRPLIEPGLSVELCVV